MGVLDAWRQGQEKSQSNFNLIMQNLENENRAIQDRARQERESIAQKKRGHREYVALELTKAILSNPNCHDDENEVVARAIACADKLLHTLEVTEQVTDKLNGEF